MAIASVQCSELEKSLRRRISVKALDLTEETSYICICNNQSWIGNAALVC